MIGSVNMEWRQAEPALPNPESQKLQDVTQELYVGIFCCVVSHIAYKICQLAFFQVVFIASLSFTVSSLARKVFEDHTFCRKWELGAIWLVQEVPLIKPLITIVATIIFPHANLLGALLSAGLGILQGLTNESAKMRYLTEIHRAELKEKRKMEA